MLFKKASPDVFSRFGTIAVSRVNTRSFGRASTGSEYDLMDLRCVADELKEYYPDETKTLCALLDRMVVHAVSNTEQSCGVSLYYPFYNKYQYSTDWKKAYLRIDAFPDYLNFLNRYEQLWLASDMQEIFDSTLNIEKTEDGSFFLPLSSEQLNVVAGAKYYVLRKIGESRTAEPRIYGVFADASGGGR